MEAISAMEATTGTVQIHVPRNNQTVPARPPLINEKVLVLRVVQLSVVPCTLNNDTYDNMPIHVHIMTQVNPKMEIEWKLRC